MVQFFLVCTFVVTELILFAVMAYDGFVAICNPLLYTVVMCQRLCAMLVVTSYTWGVACSLTLTCSAVKLSFHGFNTINHFCELSSLLSLSYSDPSLSQPLLFPVAAFNEVITLLVILTSCVLTVVST